MDNKTRISQYYNALLWYSKQSVFNMVKLNFNTLVDDIPEPIKEGYKRWVIINEDISKIYTTGTDEERKLINEVIEKIDKECHSNINKKGGK